jgi:hypothetical protein
MSYIGNDEQERVFFSKYTIVDFIQVYPNSKRATLRNAFILSTTSDEIAADLLKTFPEKYIAIENIIEEKEVLNTTPYYPPDFATSAVRIPFNVNIYDRSELLYIDAPKAWGITELLTNSVTIGISDAKVDDLSPDLAGKISFINPYGVRYQLIAIVNTLLMEQILALLLLPMEKIVLPQMIFQPLVSVMTVM